MHNINSLCSTLIHEHSATKSIKIISTRISIVLGEHVQFVNREWEFYNSNEQFISRFLARSQNYEKRLLASS